MHDRLSMMRWHGSQFVSPDKGRNFTCSLIWLVRCLFQVIDCDFNNLCTEIVRYMHLKISLYILFLILISSCSITSSHAKLQYMFWPHV
jgi:hypothetical protein